MHDLSHWLRCGVTAVATIVLVAGCATSSTAPVSEGRSPAKPAGSNSLTKALYGQLDRWRGTRYRLGGLDRSGIDCSGLTYVVYRDLFGKRLPRTTGGQEEVGRPVEMQALAPGDLVFFKTGLFQRHVGIFVADDMFLHASRSSGVRLSSLATEYWRGRYWKARRVAVEQQTSYRMSPIDQAASVPR